MKRRKIVEIVVIVLVVGCAFFFAQPAHAGYVGDPVNCPSERPEHIRTYGECCGCRMVKEVKVCAKDENGTDPGYYWGGCHSQPSAEHCDINCPEEPGEPTPAPNCAGKENQMLKACLGIECINSNWTRIEKWCNSQGYSHEKVGRKLRDGCQSPKPDCTPPTPTKKPPTPTPTRRPTLTPRPTATPHHDPGYEPDEPTQPPSPPQPSPLPPPPSQPPAVNLACTNPPGTIGQFRCADYNDKDLLTCVLRYGRAFWSPVTCSYGCKNNRCLPRPTTPPQRPTTSPFQFKTRYRCSQSSLGCLPDIFGIYTLEECQAVCSPEIPTPPPAAATPPAEATLTPVPPLANPFVNFFSRFWCTAKEVESKAVHRRGSKCYECIATGMARGTNVKEVACPSIEKPTPSPTPTPIYLPLFQQPTSPPAAPTSISKECSLCIRIENRDCNLLYPGCEASLASWGKVTSTHEPCYGTGIYPDSTCAPESKVNFPSWCETQCAARFQAFPTLPPLPAAAAAPTTTSPWPTPITTIPNFSVSLREFCQVDQNCQGWIGPLNCGQEGSFCRDKTCQKYKLECDVGFCETTSVSGNTTYQCQAGQNLHENTGLCCPDWIDDCRQYCNDYYDQQYTTGPLWCSQEEANSGAIFYLGDTCYICKKKGLYPAVVQEVACPSTEKPTPTPTATPVPNKEDEIKYAERGEINANCALPCRNPKEACFDNPWWLGNRCTDNHCEDVPDGNYVTVYPFCFRCQGEKPVERVDFDEFCESSSKPSSGLIKSVWAIEPEIESSIKLLEGWNLISLAVRPEKALTASDLVAEINRQGGLAIAVSQWQNSFWQTYLTGLDKNDFLIEPGQAYFVENLAEVEVIFSGKPINEPLPLNLKTGWNAVGFPNTREIYSAKTLLDKSPSLQTTGFFESGLWLAATKKDEDFFGIDFPILPGRGYFLKTLFPLRFSP